jgi:xanthine dehydrogenase YagS FAD-binding subunit
VRELSVSELYRGAAAERVREARMASDEVLAAVLVPPQPATQAFEKLAPRAANEFASVAAAVLLRIADGHIADARVALGGVATEPLLLDAAGAALHRREPASIDTAAAARQLALSVRAIAVPHRAALTEVAIDRALARALAAAH